MYTEQVMEHFTNPRNVGEIENADGVGEVGNAKCGDIMKIFLKIKDGIIEDVKFKTYGCASAIATSSIATEMIKGQPIEKAVELSNKAVVEALGGLPAHKIHCSVLAEQAIKAALRDYYVKQGIDPTPILVSLNTIPKTVKVVPIDAYVSAKTEKCRNYNIPLMLELFGFSEINRQ